MELLHTILGLLATLTAAGTVSSQNCDSSKCNVGIQKYYKELNCLPIQERGVCCPSKFDCTAALSGRTPGKCHLKGVAYESGASIPHQLLGDVCVPECRCSKFGVVASFQCPSKECPEMSSEPLQEGCVRLFEHNKCCSTSMHCNNANATVAAGKKPFTCEYAGKSYVIGQKFYPTEKPCLNCICQQNFDGTLNGPWCTDVKCNIELHYGPKILEGCAPIYFGPRGCCPIGWRCPTTGDTVVRAPNAASTKNAGECTFGSLRLKVSEKLNAHKPCVECTCTTPPHVGCTQRGYC